MIPRNKEKHAKYEIYYQPNDLFWGLGIEHETYLETNKLKQILPKELKEHRHPERYSIAYYDVYRAEELEKTLDDMFPVESEAKFLLPILCNSHTFLKTDRNGEHPMTLDRIPKPNPKCQELILFEWMKLENPEEFHDEFHRSFTFDGDAIQFTTQYFYKTTMQHVLQELSISEKNFTRALNSLPREGVLKQYAPFSIMKQYYPFATYLTNLKNNAICNVGTLEINITLPTKLNVKGEIEDPERFRTQHQSFARAIQWISPLIIATYGCADPLSESKHYGHLYAAGSQRVAVSRYTGLGTYDTNKMQPGIILTHKKEDIAHTEWYDAFYAKTNYKPLEELGMDLNFNKHERHGLEIRWLDAIPFSSLEEVLILLFHLADCSMDLDISNPTECKQWHRMAEQCVHLGKGYQMNVSDQHELYKRLGVCHLSKEPLMVQEVLQIVKKDLEKRYDHATCTTCFRRGEYPTHANGLNNVLPQVKATAALPILEEEESSIIESIPPSERSSMEHMKSEEPMEQPESMEPMEPMESIEPRKPKKSLPFFACCYSSSS
jgi:hypothetical protein